MATAHNDTILTVEHLSLTLGSTPILQDFSLTLKAGEILCLLGPSGCGKTTALRAISGLLDGQQGRILLHGDEVFNNGRSVSADQRRVGYIFQDYALFPHLSVYQNITYGLRKLSKDEQQQRAQEVLSLIELTHLSERFPHELSGGQQQRVALARALAPKPRLILMDEPFSNVDALVKLRMISDLKRLLKQQGISCIFVTHAKDEAFAFADRLAVMVQGAIQQLDDIEVVLNKPNSVAVANIMESGNLLPVELAHSFFPTMPLPCHADGHWLLKPQLLTAELNEQGSAEIVNTLLTHNLHRLELQMPDGRLWNYDTPEKHDWAIGQRLQLGYRHFPFLIPSA